MSEADRAVTGGDDGDPDRFLPEELMWEGRFITAKRRGRWEYAGRARGIRAAAIIAVDDGHVLLVSQHRMAVGHPTLELPAGLIGDEDGNAGEADTDAARRELEEETGYRAGRMVSLGAFYSSPGMVSESFTLMRAEDLTRVGPGGGLPGEHITVHRVPQAELPAYVDRWRAAGGAVDVRLAILMAGYLLGERG